MRDLIKTFIKYPVLGNALVVVILLFGYIGLKSLNTTFFPNIPSKYIIIQAVYPGASPEEIEEGITLKIEDNLKGITGVERVTSKSSENFASISVELKTGTDANDLLQEVNNAVNQIGSFPVGMEKISVFKQEMMDFVLSFAVNGNVNLKTLKSTARRIERDLRNEFGITKIGLSGFPDEEIEISFREDDLRAYGLTWSEAASAISSGNLKITGGKIKGTVEELQIRADNKGYYASDLGKLYLKTTSSGTIIRLKDVADVSDKWSEDPNRSYYNGKRAVIIDVNKTNDQDMFYIAAEVKEYINLFNENNDDIHLDILNDGSSIVQERIDILSQNGYLGMFLVVLFLGLSLNPRMSFWVALSIPIAFAGMFMISPFYGMTINVMSLMAMILVIGILVDDGIVIAENIYQYYERGEKPLKAALDGTLDVLPSVVSGVLTTVVIFTTFFFLEGGLGDRTKDIAFVVIVSLLISLVEATFILPAHIAHSKALKSNGKKKSRFQEISESVLFWLRDRAYAPALKFALNNPVIAIAIPIAMMIITIGALRGSIIKTTFFPIIERNEVTVSFEMPAGTRDTVTDSLLTIMEKNAWKVNDIYRETHAEGPDLIPSISRQIGSGAHQGKLRIALLESQSRDLSSMEITNMLRDQIGKIDGAEKLQVGGSTSHWGMPVSVTLRSDQIDQLRNAKEALKAELRKVQKLKDVVDNDPLGMREIKINLKDKAYGLGLTSSIVMDQIRSGFYGKEAQRLQRGLDEVRIWVRYDEQDRSSIRNLEKMRIRLNDGRSYPLGEIADLTVQRGVMSISHIDAQRVVTVEADIANQNESVPDIISEIAAEIMPAIEKNYPDVQFDFEGQNRENTKTVNAMSAIVPSMIVLMFIIIVFTFRSFLQAIIAVLLIPLALIGVAWGHFIQGYIVSMLSVFGMIALIGIVVNDSLVFINAMNNKMKKGAAFLDALFDTGISRFRPVLLTSLTTIAGVGPLMFSKSHQAQFLSPMAISVAYGLFIATFVTLLVLPALLIVLNSSKVWVLGLIRNSKPSRESVEPAIREDIFAAESE